MSLTKASYSMITGAPVNVLDYGAKGDGSTDDSAAIQAAINTGKPVVFPYATYKISTPITYTGEVNIDGNNSTILGDGQSFTFTNASNSKIKNLNFQPITTPYTILRDPNVWTATSANVIQSFQGYIPTSQDTDIWSSLSASIQAQVSVRPYQRPGLWFKTNSATAASNVLISNITGYGASIVLEGYQNSTVQNCNINGNTGAGTIFFNNGIPYDSTNTALGYTMARGLNNKAVNNVTLYGSYCGVAFTGNDYFLASGNTCNLNGESGIKTVQHDATAQLPVGAACSNGVINGNATFGNYYDGIDAGTVYGISGYLAGYTVVSSNTCMYNRATGITTEGTLYLTVIGNTVSNNGASGINATGLYSAISCNVASGNCMFGPTGINNQWDTQQMWDIFIAGDGVASSGNVVNCSYVPYTYAYLHQGQVANSGVPTVGKEGSDVGNIVQGISTSMAVSATIPTSQLNLNAKNGKYDSEATVTLPSLSTYVTVLGSTTGMVLLRDNTSGGIAMFTFDPLAGVVTSITNGITGLTAQISSGNFQIQVTSGTVPRSIGWAAFLSQ
jgi:parallel beta-helix repeat protein